MEGVLLLNLFYKYMKIILFPLDTPMLPTRHFLKGHSPKLPFIMTQIQVWGNVLHPCLQPASSP
jgi:hypothetical protein